MHGGDHCESLRRFEVQLDALDKVRQIEANVDENVLHRHAFGDVDRHQTAMTVVHEKIAAERTSRIVVDAARAVSDVAHDDGVGAGESVYNVGNDTRVRQQTFGKLQRNAARL